MFEKFVQFSYKKMFIKVSDYPNEDQNVWKKKRRGHLKENPRMKKSLWKNRKSDTQNPFSYWKISNFNRLPHLLWHSRVPGQNCTLIFHLATKASHWRSTFIWTRNRQPIIKVAEYSNIYSLPPKQTLWAEPTNQISWFFTLNQARRRK